MYHYFYKMIQDDTRIQKGYSNRVRSWVSQHESNKNMQAQKHSIVTFEGQRRTALRPSQMVGLRYTKRGDHPKFRSG